MSSDKLVQSLGDGLLAAIIGLLLALFIKWTWNATMPYLFALPTITWGKAWCIRFLYKCITAVPVSRKTECNSHS